MGGFLLGLGIQGAAITGLITAGNGLHWGADYGLIAGISFVVGAVSTDTARRMGLVRVKDLVLMNSIPLLIGGIGLEFHSPDDWSCGGDVH